MEYSIGQVAKMLNVSAESIRNWERQKLIPKCARRPTNVRRFSFEDVEAIRQLLVNKQSNTK